MALTYSCIDDARQISERLVAAECRRSGVSQSHARRWLSRRIGAAETFLDRLNKDRVKRVPHDVTTALKEAFIRHAEGEAQRIAHEMSVARQVGMAPDSREILAARSALSRLAKAIDEVSKS